MNYIKKNKKIIIVIITIILVLSATISLLIIQNNKNTKKDVDEIFSVIGEKNYVDLTFRDDISQLDLDRLVTSNYKSSYFKETAIKKINEYIKEQKHIYVMNIMVLLSKYNIYDDEIKNIFINYINGFKYDSLKEKELVELIADYSSLGEYRTRESDDIIISMIKDNCDKLIMEDGKGGYYDSLKEKYKSYIRRVDPLGRNDSDYFVGTYTESELYEYLGDILVRRYQKKWYGTSSYDTNNSDTTNYYFKDKSLISYIKTDYYNREHILTILKDSENYVLGDYIINIKGNYINVIGYKVLSYQGSLEYR